MEQQFSVFYFTCDHVILCVVVLKYDPTFVVDDMYVLQLGFHPVAVVSKLVQNQKETDIYKRRNNILPIQKQVEEVEYNKENQIIVRQCTTQNLQTAT